MFEVEDCKVVWSSGGGIAAGRNSRSNLGSGEGGEASCADIQLPEFALENPGGGV